MRASTTDLVSAAASGLVIALAMSAPAMANKENPEFSIECREKPAEGEQACTVAGIGGSAPLRQQTEQPKFLTNIRIIVVAEDADPALAESHGHEKSTPEVKHPGTHCHQWVLIGGIWQQVHC